MILKLKEENEIKLNKPKDAPVNNNNQKYDFNYLSTVNPELKKFLYYKHDLWLLDWRMEGCLIELNKAILKYRFNLGYWNMNYESYLVPCINSREDYIDYVVNIIKKIDKVENNIFQISLEKCDLNNLFCLDIGTGSSLIYPLIGSLKYDLNFYALDINIKS